MFYPLDLARIIIALERIRESIVGITYVTKASSDENGESFSQMIHTIGMPELYEEELACIID